MYKSVAIKLTGLLLLLLLASLYFFKESQKEKQQSVINIYSARKEELVRELFDLFQKNTNIKINFITDEAGKLLSRIKSEGATSEMDVFWTADLLSLVLADDVLQALPEEIKAMTDDSSHGDKWTAIAKRARVVAYSKSRVKPNEMHYLDNYEDLGLSTWHGRLVTRSSASTYNQFLISSIIYHDGLRSAANWCRGVAENFARNPQGGDTDQIRAIASGIADVAVVNHYYYARLLHSSNESDRAVVKDIDIIYPNQNNRGTHVNISGIGIAKNAPHYQNAVTFIKFLLSDEAQAFFAQKNHEYPVRGSAFDDFLMAHSNHKFDTSPLTEIANHYAEAERVSVQEGWN